MGKKSKKKDGRKHAASEASLSIEAADLPRRGKGAVKAGPVDAAVVAQRLNSVSLHLLRRLAREEAASGTRPARLSALATLASHGPCTLGTLARLERVTPPSMTRLVHALESDGLAERSPSVTDGRQVDVRITPAGSTLLATRGDQRTETITGWLAPLSADDLRVLDTATSLLETTLRDA
ncbi:MAG: MarR family transcriptional regulator [Chloroflexi bacterium]|nr:MarR family transcriptional regulator [Chloroflexota bacterium]